VENYPNLKADEQVKTLMEELTSTENTIAFSRQFYNDITTKFNTSQQTFPGNIIAGMFLFRPAELFELKIEKERETPAVNLSVRS
jgi:LemA protein